MTQALQVQQQLENSIQHHRLSHAFLFVGDKGTGKSQTALWLAQRLFCQSKSNQPCGKCRHCVQIAEQQFIDVMHIYPEGTGIKTDQMKEMQYEFNHSGLESKKRILIVHQAETMNETVGNRLLKFIEEPLGDMLVILIATNEQQILPTIRSRCQIIRFTHEYRQEDYQNETQKMIAQLTFDEDERHLLLQDESFLIQLDLVNRWWDLLVKRDPFAFVFVQQHIMSEFKARAQSFDDRTIKNRLFDLLMIKAKMALKEESNPIYLSIFDQAMSAKEKMMAHVNFQSICEQFAWRVLNQEGL